MEFRILGPFEVGDDEGRFRIDAAKQRALLAVLVLNCNEVVSADRLIEELWGEQRPASAEKLVQTYVSQLRKMLGREAIVTRPPGYLLRVEEDALDAARFRCLVTAGCQLTADGDVGRAVSVLGEALALWRGPALANVKFESFARNQVEQLEEERLAALVSRIDCELELGHDRELVAELELLVGRYPLQERLRYQLMLALYRSGRQADALAAYQEARRVLVDELGLEPSEELQHLERAILRHDPGLALRAPLLPRALPVPSSSFIGRTGEIAGVERLIRTDRPRIVTITGVGGVGKTRLALAACERLTDAFPDGVFFVSLAPIRDATVVPGAIADGMGVVASPGESAGDAVIRSLRDRRALLVLDSFEHVLDAAAWVADLLARTERVNVLISSQAPIRVSGEHVFTLDPLREHEAVDLFMERAVAARQDFARDDHVAAICARLDRLPLAIELAAAQANALSSSVMLARLERRLPLRARGPRDAPERQQTLHAAMDWSHDLLSPAEQRLFRGLGVFDGGWTLEAAERVCDADVDTLAMLVDKCLVRSVDDRYWMLQTVREYAVGRLEEHGEQDVSMRRLAEYLVALAAEAPANELAVAPLVLELGREIDNVRAAFAWALAAGESELALRLASEAYWFTSGRGVHLVEQSQWLDSAFAAAATAPTAERAYALALRAQVAYDLADFERAGAFALKSLNLYRATGDETGSIHVLRGLGTIARAQGRHADARDWYEQSLALATRASDFRKECYALKSLGDLERELGNLDEAAALFDRSAELATESGDRMILTYILHGVGDVALAAGDPARAARLYREAMRLSLELAMWRPVVQVVAGLAAVAAVERDPARAGRLWGALEALEQTLGWRILPHERVQYDTAISECRVAAPLAFRSAAENARAMTPSEIADYVLTESRSSSDADQPRTGSVRPKFAVPLGRPAVRDY